MSEEFNMDYELEAIKRWEPNTKALVDWNPIEACKRLDISKSGPLSGWSVGVKDIIDVQGMPTLCNASFVSREPVGIQKGIGFCIGRGQMDTPVS